MRSRQAFSHSLRGHKLPHWPFISRRALFCRELPEDSTTWRSMLPGNRLFIAATGNHSVEVIDLQTGKDLQSITGLGKPHGLAWIAETGSLYVADGTLAELRVYRGSPLKVCGRAQTLGRCGRHGLRRGQPLAICRSRRIKCGAIQPRVAVVDTDHFRLVANIPVATHPEALDIDPASKRVFVNVAKSNEVAIIGTATKAITAHWKLTKAADNVPMAFDSGHQLLYVACRTPGMLIAIDAATGKEVASLPIADGADDLFYDPSASPRLCDQRCG